MTTVGFEPTPVKTSALNWRLRPLGQMVNDTDTAIGTPYKGRQYLDCGRSEDMAVIDQI